MINDAYDRQYKVHLTNLIRGRRRDLGVPRRWVKVGDGIGGPDPNPQIAVIRKAQAAATGRVPEFAGTVALAKTADFWGRPRPRPC